MRKIYAHTRDIKGLLGFCELKHLKLLVNELVNKQLEMNAENKGQYCDQ